MAHQVPTRSGSFKVAIRPVEKVSGRAKNAAIETIMRVAPPNATNCRPGKVVAAMVTGTKSSSAKGLVNPPVIDNSAATCAKSKPSCQPASLAPIRREGRSISPQFKSTAIPITRAIGATVRCAPIISATATQSDWPAMATHRSMISVRRRIGSGAGRPGKRSNRRETRLGNTGAPILKDCILDRQRRVVVQCRALVLWQFDPCRKSA